MRCTFKVAYRDGLSMVSFGEPYGGGGEAEELLMRSFLNGWQKLQRFMSDSSEEDKTARAVKSVTRAMRYDTWVFVRLEVKEKIDRANRKMMLWVGVSMDDPNKVPLEALEAGRRACRELADVVMVTRLSFTDGLRERIVWDAGNEFLNQAANGESVKEAMIQMEAEK